MGSTCTKCVKASGDDKIAIKKGKQGVSSSKHANAEVVYNLVDDENGDLLQVPNSFETHPIRFDSENIVEQNDYGDRNVSVVRCVRTEVGQQTSTPNLSEHVEIFEGGDKQIIKHSVIPTSCHLPPGEMFLTPRLSSESDIDSSLRKPVVTKPVGPVEKAFLKTDTNLTWLSDTIDKPGAPLSEMIDIGNGTLEHVTVITLPDTDSSSEIGSVEVQVVKKNMDEYFTDAVEECNRVQRFDKNKKDVFTGASTNESHVMVMAHNNGAITHMDDASLFCTATKFPTLDISKNHVEDVKAESSRHTKLVSTNSQEIASHNEPKQKDKLPNSSLPVTTTLHLSKINHLDTDLQQPENQLKIFSSMSTKTSESYDDRIYKSYEMPVVVSSPVTKISNSKPFEKLEKTDTKPVDVHTLKHRQSLNLLSRKSVIGRLNPTQSKQRYDWEPTEIESYSLMTENIDKSPYDEDFLQRTALYDEHTQVLKTIIDVTDNVREAAVVIVPSSSTSSSLSGDQVMIPRNTNKLIRHVIAADA